MIILTYCLLAIALLTTIFAVLKTKDIFHPSLLAFIFLAVPVYFSMMRLSSLQAKQWEDLTYILLAYAIVCFIIIPGIFSIQSAASNHFDLSKLQFHLKPGLIYSLSGVAIVLYLLESYVSSGTLLPFLYVNNDVNIHTTAVPILSILTNAMPTVLVVANYLAFSKQRKPIYWIIIVLLILLPLTRLARFDVVCSLLPLLALIFYQLKRKKLFLTMTAVLLIVCVVGGAFLGQYRMTYGYKYDVKYADNIKYTGNSGIFEMNAILYGYFPLSIENLDRFVKKNADFDEYKLGAYTFRGVLAGIFQLDNVRNDFPMYQFLSDKRSPLNGSANVDTAMVEFSMDLGYKLAFIPMLLFGLIGTLLYNKGKSNVRYRVIYLLFAPSYVLLCFQNMFIDPRLVHETLFMVLLFSLASRPHTQLTTSQLSLNNWKLEMIKR